MCTGIPRCQRHVVARDILLCPNTFKITQPDHSLVFLVYNSSVTLVPLVMVLKASDESHQDALSFSLEGNRAQCIKNGIDHRSSQHQKRHAIIQMSLALKGSHPGKNKHKASQPLQTSTYFKTNHTHSSSSRALFPSTVTSISYTHHNNIQKKGGGLNKIYKYHLPNQHGMSPADTSLT